MATLISETQWHGNPRPTEAYAWGVYVESVPSPYYKDGRDVPVYAFGKTDTPFAGYPAAEFTNTTVTLTGTFYRQTSLDVFVTAVDPVSGDIPVTILYVWEPGGPYTAAQAATAYADYWNAEAGTIVSATALDGVITFAPAGSTTSLTVTAANIRLP